jgi:hypothetical protein
MIFPNSLRNRPVIPKRIRIRASVLSTTRELESPEIMEKLRTFFGERLQYAPSCTERQL